MKIKTYEYEIQFALPFTIVVNEKDSTFAEAIAPDHFAEWMIETAKKHRENNEAAVFTVLP